MDMSVTAAPLTAPPSPIDDARKQRDADKARNAQQALETLKRSKSNVKDDMKARAREKLEALKARLQRMRMMGATPRQIAQLARELGAAVKAYAAAGGSSNDVGMTQTPTAANANQAPTPAPGTPEDAAKDAAAQPQASGEAKPGEGEAKPENPYDKAIKANAEDLARKARAAGESDEDRKFIEAAKRLAKQLKEAAAEAARKARQSGDTGDVDEAKKAAEDADKAVADAERDMGGGAGGGLISLTV